MDKERMTQLFSDLALPWSPVFMAVKLQELYGTRLGPDSQVKALPDKDPPLPRDYMPPALGGFEGAKALLRERASLLAEAQKRYGLPPSLIAAVLLIESNMGNQLGEGLALHALASMAATRTSEQALQGLTRYKQPDAILKKEMDKRIREKSAWAYKELHALILYCETNGIDLLRLPGSVYGAIGLCQFMPSNISAYGVDSDQKGNIDLFSLPDAAHSIGNFLKAHGFSENLAVKQQVEVVRKYNHSDSYATLVLGLSYQLAGKRVPAELPMFSAAAGGPRKGWWPKTRPAYRLPPLGSYRLH
jgi:membrane-bound lytic murein transglycosylase B